VNRVAPSAVLLAILAGGCATRSRLPPPLPLSAEQGAAAFEARSLRAEDLARFLRDNLGSVPPDGSWDFETLAWASFYYHPSLAVARAQWALARASGETATARPNPTLTLTPGYNSTREGGISPWFPGISFDFLLQSRAQRARQGDLARADTEAARLAVVVAAWQVRAELRQALAELDRARQREALLRRQAELAQKLLTLLEQRLTAGRVGRADVTTARLTLLRAETAAGEAQAIGATARARAAAALGLPLAALADVKLPAPPVGDRLDPAAWRAARRLSLQSRADVIAALAHYQSTQAALGLAIAKQNPGLHLGPGYQWDQGANKWSLPLTFELPLFHHNGGPVAEAVARRAEAAAQFTATQAAAVAALDRAESAQAAAQAQLVRARQLRAAAQGQAGATQRRFALGAADQVELQTALLDAMGADVTLTDAETAAAVATGQMEDALQIPFAHLAQLTASAQPPSP
jgi:cobalt-zinc-cadmium efflux system outer membrane protein